MLAQSIFIIILVFILNNNLDTNNLIKYKYIGVYAVTEEYDSHNDSDITIEHKSFVFNKKDKQLKKYVTRLEKEYGEAFERKFVFWQTAFANGFEPKNITKYKGNDSFSKNITLFFTIGPILILELLINSIANSFNLMIFPIIGLLFSKRFYYEDLLKLESIFKN